MKHTLFRRLPERIRYPTRTTYRAFERFVRTVHPRRETAEQLHRRFVQDVFESKRAYERYRREFEDSYVLSRHREAIEEFRTGTAGGTFGDIGVGLGEKLYALTRSLEPATVLETGVCNGLSTMCLLLALRENGTGSLVSVDYPYRADEPLSQFRDNTFDKYGGAAIPADKDPGWMVPDELKDRWTLRVGKSQREVPLALSSTDELDLFVHDSEHSTPCMLFEFEVAWEWLTPGGLILSDDIDWNDAFETFVRERDCDAGLVAPGVGYIRKPGDQ